MAIAQLISLPLAQAAVAPPAFELSPSSGTYYLSCETVTVDMRIYTDNTETDSANIIIDYDDTMATITDEDGGTPGIQIATGSAYNNHASYTVDESGDRILMTGFNIATTYNSGAGYGTFGSFTLTPIGAGTANFNIDFTPASTTDSNIAETVTSNDILNDVGDASFTFVADAIAPYLNSYSPAQSATDVAINQNVTFRIHDDECGVDLSTLSVTVKGVEYTQSGGNTFSASGSASNYLITVNPASNFTYGETVNVIVDGDDVYGVSMSTVNYSFDVIDDTTAPAVSNRNPAASATDVSIGSNVAFNITDAVSGVDLSSVSVVVDGVTYTQSGPNTFGYSGNSSNYAITVNPASNFDYNEVINVSIDADDLNSNTMSTINYSFTVEDDSTPPSISSRNPAASATDVSIGSNVTFTISDGKSGVDLSTLSVDVDGVTYTQSGPNTFGSSGSSSSYNITINPDSDFSRGDTINVSIDASDFESNAMTTDSYSFDVIDNAVPTITALTNKTVTAGDLLVFIVNATDTDGDTVSVALDAPSLPAGATLSNVSATQWIFTWTPTEDDVGVYTDVDFEASDDGPGSSTYVETIQITVNSSGASNNAPDITSLNDQTVYQGSILNLILHAVDTESDVITLSATTTELSALTLTPISNGTANLNIDTSNFSIGTHVITVTAEDDNSDSSQETFSVTVNALSTPTTGNAPTIATLANQNLIQGSVATLLISASDVDDDTLTIGATTSELSALTLTPISNGLATLKIDTDNLSIGTSVITVSATDDETSPNTTQSTFSVTVTAAVPSTTGNDPVLQAIQDQTLVQGSIINVTLSASDIDGDTLTFSASTLNSSALSLANVSNGLATLTIDTDQLDIGANIISVLVTDDELPSNSDQVNFSVTVSAVATSTCTGTTTITGGGAPPGVSPFDYFPHLRESSDPFRETLNPTPPAPTPPEEPATYSAAPIDDEGAVYVRASVTVTADPTVKSTPPPAIPEIPPAPVEPLICEPEIVQIEVPRYIPRTGRASTENAEPILIYAYPEDDTQYSVFEPVMMVIRDDNVNPLESFSMKINGKMVSHQLNVAKHDTYNYYSLVHTPEFAYQMGSTQVVEVSFMETTAESGDIYRTYSSSFKVGSSNIQATLHEAAEEIPTQRTPAELGLLLKNLKVNMDDYGILYVEGEIQNADEVEAIWHGREETLTVVKRVKGNTFKIRAPLHFENGGYFVDVIGRHASGIETEPARVTFTVKNDFIKYDVVPGKDVLYQDGSRLWVIPFIGLSFTTLWYWRKSWVIKGRGRS